MALGGPRNATSNIKGDVNADGDVNIADINAVIDVLLGGRVNPACDVNRDGDVNISDINMLIDLILKGPVAPDAETGMYMGVIGYNQTLTTKDISVLDTTTVGQFNEFVSSLSTQPGRLLYYSVDKAIDALSAAQYPENLQNVAIVTFTKGLDQGSLMMTDKYETETEYAEALSARISDQLVYNRPIKSYTVGLLSDNVKDANKFRYNLYTLASDSTKAMEVSSMAEANTRFQSIADDLVRRNMSEKLTLVFPGVGTGTRIRFTFDEVDESTVDESQVYIEGTFSLKTRSLTNIIYQGMTCTAGDSVAASSVDGMFVSLVFSGIQLDSEERIEKQNIKEWYWVEDLNLWEVSTEFSLSRIPDIESSYSSALVMLLLDCSSVLDNDFVELQNAANAFTERMLNYNTIPGMYTVNGVSFMMVPVEGGTFTMGVDSTAVETGFANDDELPAHEVTLSPYSIGQTEVTQELWLAVMGSNPSGFDGNLKRPVEQVSWDDCQEFIARLNAITGKKFRLPTEAEWEYAARGGNKSMNYPYAGSESLEDVAWYYGNSYAMGPASPDYGTHVVGTKRGNELGIYDMCGNVFEWCSDWYGAYPEEPQTDPVGPETGVRRVTRGGGWFSVDRDSRVTFRNNDAPTSRSYNLGLRLAL
ncbi:MAG: SUMF1/EgtB/PvdO family nonheme iron enzyme [Muribaculaceae bacterium]|nr:SUMF1/EgtB/PvdO family nonheme iron enzyme [Muribaculaceae bacterium]